MSYRDDAILDAISGRRPSAEGWIRANCPLCEDRKGSVDRNFSLAVQVASSIFTCWRCGAKGKLGHDLSEDIPQAAKAAGAVTERQVFDPPDGFESFGALEGSIAAQPAWDYVLGRLSMEVVRDFGLGACLFGKQGGRIIIPLTYDDGAWSGWVGRDFTGRQRPKYLYPSGMSRGVMFNARALARETEEPALVMEGCFDVLPHLDGLDAVGCLGKPTVHHTETLLAAKRPLAIALDGDAWQEAYALALQLRHCGKRAGYIHFPPGTDPGDMKDTGELLELAHHCIE